MMHLIFKLFLVFLCTEPNLTMDNSIGNGGSWRNITIRYPKRASFAKTQSVFPKSMPFPCDTKFSGPSKNVPTSVHSLRPGDIKIIGALGDSLIAGNGAMGEAAIYTIFEYRGVSWCIGGESSWRQYLTLPNILKEFNPNLRGFSLGTGEHFIRSSYFNVAFPVASSLDALFQAKNLHKRMLNDPAVDFENDWKLITVFFGANDICTLQCANKTLGSAAGYAQSMMKALDYLRDNMPRTFVNLMPVIDVTVSVRIKRSMPCRMVHSLFCMCFHLSRFDPVPYMGAMARSYHKIMEDIVDSGRYDKKKDFTVVWQPFIKYFNLPKDPRHYYDEVMDTSFISYDCFHFSQKGHALAANLLWNNMLEPVGNKSMKSIDNIMQKFNCPSKNAPYLFTSKNSKTFLASGRQ